MKSFRLWIYSLIVRSFPETRCFAFKVKFLRWCGATIGKNVRINSSATFLGNGTLTIGDDVWIGAKCHFSPVGKASITIGSHIDFGPEVMLLTGSHKIEPDGEHIGGEGYSQSIAIGDGCWLGARSTILPGVTLANKTIVAAGAVVNKSSSVEKTLLAGVPASMRKKYE